MQLSSKFLAISRKTFLFILVVLCSAVTYIVFTTSFKNNTGTYSLNSFLNRMDTLFFSSKKTTLNEEKDLVYSKPISLNLEIYKKMYKAKVEDVKLHKVWKKLQEVKSCWKGVEANVRCVDTACNSSFPPPSSDENFLSVLTPLTRVKDVSERLSVAFGPYKNVSKVTFVTAASSNHFKESLSLIKNLREIVFPKLKNFTFYFYDLGLKPEEKKKIIEKCRCEFRSFPFDLLPKRFRFLKGYTWKVIIIQAVLPHSELLIWTDASIRFKPVDLQPLFDNIKSSGILLGRGGHSIADHTSKTMLDYFGDDACEYSAYHELTATMVMMYNEPFIKDVVVKTWWACAIDPKCMCTYYDNRELYCNTGIRKYSKCHRFDQAAITLILIKLFREHVESFSVSVGKYHFERREPEGK